MATYRFDLNQEYGERLEADAAKKRMSIQEYIRYKLFGEVTIFTVDEVINRIQVGDYKNKELLHILDNILFQPLPKNIITKQMI